MLSRFRNMTKWGVIAVVIAMVGMIVLDWGAQMTGMNRAPYALKVNGEEITFDDVDRVTAQRENAPDLSDTDRVEAYTTAINDIIAERLAKSMASDLEMAATDEEVVLQTQDRLFRNEQGQIDIGRYNRARRELSSGEWIRYESFIRDDITLWKIYNFVAGGIPVTPADLRDYFNLRYQRVTFRHILVRPGDFISAEAARAYYDSHGDSFVVAERVKGRHILFPIPQNAAPEMKMAARSAAEGALIRIQGGEGFNRVYTELKADTSGRYVVQDLDWFYRGQMVPEFDTVAFNYPPGRPTEIIETQFGYHIAFFDAHEMAKRQPFDEVSDGIRAILSGESEAAQARKRAESIRERLDGGEPFENLARQFSSGRSRERGGLLGDLTPGEMTRELYPDSGALERIGREVGTPAGDGRIFLDPTITRLLFELEVGKNSEVVSSGHGYHVARIEGRRGADPELWEEMKERVAKEYRDFQKNQIVRDWTNSLRARAKIVFSDSVKSRMEL